ncbi:hypothetical protein FRB96_006691 [Tulasnella sp. 330]|nr:hypothetical protein FRB96_006691 [Tulasnella sp. 330]
MATDRFYTAASTYNGSSSPRIVLSPSQSNKGHKYYAVKVGRETGIFTSWGDCSAVTQGYSNSVYQGFSTREQAERFLSKGDYPPVPPKQPTQSYSHHHGTPSEDLVEAMGNFTLGGSEDGGDDGWDHNRRRTTSSSSTPYHTPTCASQKYPQYTSMSSTATRSPPRMATSSGFHSGDGGVGASMSYGGLTSYHSTARLDSLAEAYPKAHHYPPAQVARIRRVFLRRAHDEEDLDPMEIMEGLTMEGMDEDKAGFLLSLVCRD